MKDMDDTLIQNTPSDGGEQGWRWIEMTSITNYGDLSYNEIRPANNTWNSNQGMGKILTYNGPSANRVLLRGGSWYNGANAGSFAMITNWNTGYQNDECWVALCPVTFGRYLCIFKSNLKYIKIHLWILIPRSS